MTDYYIDASGGNNSNTGLSPAQAWLDETNVKSEFLLGTFGAGDYIRWFRGQTHTITDIVCHGSSGSLGSPITFAGYGFGTPPVLQKDTLGGNGWLIGHWDGNSGGNYIRLEGLHLDGGGLIGGSGLGIVWIEDVVGWEVHGCSIYNTGSTSNATGMKVRLDAEAVITWSKIWDIYEEGVYGGSAGSTTDNAVVEIYDSTIHSCGGETIDLKDGTTGAIIKRCALFDSGTSLDRQIISMGGDGHLVENCRIFGPNANEGIWMGVYTTPGESTVRGCLIDGPDNGFRFSSGTNNVEQCTVVNNSAYAFRSDGGTNNVSTTIARLYGTRLLGSLSTDDMYTSDPSFISPAGITPYAIRRSSGATGYGWWEVR